jgi:hypothetical protein
MMKLLENHIFVTPGLTRDLDCIRVVCGWGPGSRVKPGMTLVATVIARRAA